MLGVLGGMGPLATADFMHKLVQSTPARTDQDHPQVIVFSNSKIPDRVGPILGQSATSPLPDLIDSAQRLQQFGARVIAMPCNTAHYWHGQIASAVTIPFLHIADVTCEEITRTDGDNSQVVGVLATQGTLCARIYQERFKAFGIPYQLPEADAMKQTVLPAIAAVKRGSMDEAGRLLARTVEQMTQKGVARVVLACSELPAVLGHVDTATRERCIDATEVLARASLAAIGVTPRPTPITD